MANPPTLSRAPVSVRKMVQILKDPVIFTSVTTIAIIGTLSTWFYYSRKDKTKISLVFGNVTRSDILLEDELNELVERHVEQFRVYHVLNEPPVGWEQGIGFITKDILEQRLPSPASDIKILICGPPGLIKSVTNV
ncbi:hypothetical protein CU098_001538, partial [Rhizopus stolonifer]